MNQITDKELMELLKKAQDLQLLNSYYGMKKNFAKWLIDNNYKVKTPSNLPSTVPQYLNAVDNIIKWENIDSWETLPKYIDRLVRDYDTYGSKADLGKKSHNTYISALKRFQDYWNR